MKSINNSIFREAERKFINFVGEYVPSFIGTKVLTLFAFFSSILIFIGYYLSTLNSVFIHLASLGVALQWLFDCLDGHIGRKRKEGFVKWGFYMDHFFDYFFLCAVVLGYYQILNMSENQKLIYLMISSAIMLSFALFYGAVKDSKTNFKISFKGLFAIELSPIEFRLFVIGLNTLVYFTNLEIIFARYVNWFIGLFVVILIVMVYNNQKILHDLDMKNKLEKENNIKKSN